MDADSKLALRSGRFLWVTWALRTSAAVALTAGSLIEFRNRYHGDCVIPGDGLGDGDFLLFLFFPVLFFLGFIWSVSELVHPLVLRLGMFRLPARAASIAVGLVIYGVVGFAAWLMWPVPVDIHEQGFRAFVSGFWSIGFLLETGNFSHHSCGY